MIRWRNYSKKFKLTLLGMRKGTAPIALAICAAPAPADAHVWLPFAAGLGAPIPGLLSTSSQCISYEYDKNGNRIAVSWGGRLRQCDVGKRSVRLFCLAVTDTYSNKASWSGKKKW